MTGAASQLRRSTALVVWTVLLLASVFHFLRAVEASGAHGFADFPIFLDQAETFLATGRLYVDAAAPANFAPAAPVYKFPPLFAALIFPLVVDGTQYADELVLWSIHIALYPLIVVMLVVGIGRADDARWWAIVSLLAMNFEPYFETLWRLQLELPILLLLVLAAIALGRRRDGAAGAAVGVAFSFKIYPAFVMLYFVVSRRWRGLLWFAASVALVGLATLIVIGPGEHVRYLVEIFPGLLGEQPSRSSENLALARFMLVGFDLDPGLSKRLGQALVGLMVLVSIAIVARRAETRAGGPGTLAAFALFVPLMLLAMPNSWVNYQLVLLLPFVVLAGVARSAEGGERHTLWALLVAAYVPTLFYWPCAAPSVSWPCAETPLFLGIARLPRPLHDLAVDARVLTPLLLWVGLLSWLWGLRAGHRA